jgi:CRISPR-associated protein Cmr3
VNVAAWKGYRLIPEDVWFFRDGRPSIAGADHYLRSIFPPFPSTVYGLVRTQRMLEEGVDLTTLSKSVWPSLPEALRKQIGDWGETGTLRLRGPWLLRGHEILLPAPLDLRFRIDRGKKTGGIVHDVLRLLPGDDDRSSRNWSHPVAPMEPCVRRNGGWAAWKTPRGEKDPETSAGWFVTLSGMNEWLSGGAPQPGQIVSNGELWVDELRTGVGLDSSRRRHEEHQLYTFGFVRLQENVSLGFELSGGELQCHQYARFGGENRAAAIEEGPLLSAELGKFGTMPPAALCTLTLATPAIFPDGALPPGHHVHSGVVPGPVLAGGWDLARHGPKPLRRAVPAGSVYWLNGEAPAMLGSWSEKTEEGFGLMLVGHQPRRNHG